jgi:aryl-alcohol dehydrogenase-like predicted oxidoreductase
LLIGCDPATWPPIPGLDAAETLALIDAFAAEFGRESVADLCLAYVRGQDWIDGVVVGMETDHELDANLRLFVRPPLNPQACQDVAAYLPRVPEQLLNPALWPKGQ